MPQLAADLPCIHENAVITALIRPVVLRQALLELCHSCHVAQSEKVQRFKTRVGHDILIPGCCSDTKTCVSLIRTLAKSTVPASNTPAKQNPFSRLLEGVCLTVLTRETVHEYFICTGSKRVNVGTAAAFIAEQTASRDELGHKAFPFPQRVEKRQNKSYKEGRKVSYISCPPLVQECRMVPHSLQLKSK